ncbi:hypothetical protein KY290_033581 [Solanum tuberosum]|uniref:DUF4216 domain-containing protein n=1 Tax=Solanum tuberosum TaxID=4113 RepID=A0ABQ7U2I4_SOLTU|nr:hypothetical protein KY289_032953 [Solanum tuberosum]KAH0647590.1 hypothetical protein KY285_032838 [Solanum tuberosum]KAH0740538.1 hypothetical protein KY290_033581 [Solanum tuberosum]
MCFAKRYSGYLINGYRFHVRQCDARRKTQNSGVTLVASTTSLARSKDKNPIVCDWYEVENDTYGLTYVYFNKRFSQEEPFVLGSQVHQCFYVQDPYDQDRHYVMKTVPIDLFNMSDQVDSNLPQKEFVTQQLEVEYEEEFEDESTDEFEDESENEYEDESENKYEDELEDESEEEFEDDAPLVSLFL